MLFYENRTDDYSSFDVKSNFEFPPHLHHNLEIFVCTEGQLNVSCNFRQMTMQRGDLMIAFSNDIHSFSGGEGRGIGIIVNPQTLPLFTSHIQGWRYENFLCSGDELFIECAESYLAELKSEKNIEVMTGYLYILLGTAIRELPYDEEKRRIGDNTFAVIMKYISENYTEQISLKMLSRRFGVDACYLSRMFTERISYGFLKYLHHLRVEHAKNLLITTDLNIYEIIEKSGFSDQTTFNRVFREIVGMTPAQFRTNCDTQTEITPSRCSIIHY